MREHASARRGRRRCARDAKSSRPATQMATLGELTQQLRELQAQRLNSRLVLDEVGVAYHRRQPRLEAKIEELERRIKQNFGVNAARVVG
jgi:cell fate (sporulation/competence/biofilm development) regulator YlbF (YheA/YmcA/DUF963 family)